MESLLILVNYHVLEKKSDKTVRPNAHLIKSKIEGL